MARRSVPGRRRRIVAIAGLAAVAVAVPLWAGVSDTARREVIIAVTGMAVSLVALGLAAWSHFFSGAAPERDLARLADDLADNIRDEWRAEASTRLLDTPGVLPLRWANDGDLREYGFQGRFEQFAEQLATAFHAKGDRLLVLGEPGAGKTVLAIMLVLGLVAKRGRGAATPVLLTVSSWDPLTERLPDWLDRTLGTVYYSGRRDIPSALRAHRLIIPVLDGLDEMPESARRSAVAAINETLGGSEPIVLTCRTAEYADVVAGGSEALGRAPVVNVQPVEVVDLAAYLCRVAWPPGTDWSPVFASWEQDPGGPLAAALSTPLMISVARTVYERGGGRPGELLAFPTRHGVEDHLFERLIEAVYVPPPEPGQAPAERLQQAAAAAAARRWLTELARYLHTSGKRELVWWEMSRSMLAPWAAPAVGLTGGLIMMVVVSGCTALAEAVDSDSTSHGNAIIYGTFAGILFAVGATLVWYATATATPGRLSFVLRGSAGRLRSGFVTGVAFVAMPAVPVFIVSGITLFIVDGWNLDAVILYAVCAAVAVAAAVLLGLATAVQRWLGAPVDHATQADPAEYLRQDRRSALAGASLAGIVTAAGFAPLIACALVLGGAVGRAVTGWPGAPGSFDWHALLVEYGRFDPWHRPPQAVALIIMPGLMVTVWLLSTRAWTKFVVMRWILAVQRRLPWRLLAFLADARHRQLVRQSSGRFQFQHVRLQEHLANSTGPVRHQTATAQPTFARRTVVVVVVVVTMLLTPLLADLPRDEARTVLTGQSSSISALAFSADGMSLASGSENGAIMLWDTTGSGHHVRTLFQGVSNDDVTGSSLYEKVQNLAFSPDGRSLISVSQARAHLWDVPSGRRPSLYGASFSPNGRLVVGLYFDRIRMWDSLGSLIIQSAALDEGAPVMTFSPNGARLAITRDPSNRAVVLRTDSGQVVTELPPRHGAISALTYSPDGSVLAVAADNEVALWNVRERVWRTKLIGHTNVVNSVMFDSTSQVIITGSNDGIVRMWRSATGTLVKQWIPNLRFGPPIVSPDGRTVAVFGGEGTAGLFDVADGHPIAELRTPRCNPTSIAGFTPDSRRVVTEGCDGVQTWNVADGRLLDELIGHLGTVNCLAINPRGGTLATGGDDTSIRLWDLP